jgi:hypothetical protein
MKLWDYDPDTLLPNLPTMVTFPKLHDFYRDWAHDLVQKGVDIRLGHELIEIVERGDDGVTIRSKALNNNKEEGDHLPQSQGDGEITETFDELILAVLADDALKLLGKVATRKEKFVLGGASFYDDITVTHSDSGYFEKIYETEFNEELCGKPTSKAQEDQIAFSRGEQEGQDGEAPGYRPMYYTHSYASDPKKIEMSFDCTNYQHQFRMGEEFGGVGAKKDKPDQPYDQHVFQSIFLDKNNEEMWTWKEIDESKVIEKKWWHQLGHRWVILSFSPSL